MICAIQHRSAGRSSARASLGLLGLLGLLVPAAIAVIATPRPALSQTRADARCRDTIAKGSTKHVRTMMQAIQSCHADRSAGRLPLSVDCNDPDEADQRGKVAKREAQLRSRVGGEKDRCFDSAVLLDQQYTRCTAPAMDVDDGGPTTGIDDYAELAECVIALGRGLLSLGSAQMLGAPTAPLTAAPAECQESIGDGIERVLTTFGKERRKCQRTIDKQQQGLSYGCGQSDPRGKIGKSLVKLNDLLVDDCGLSAQELQDIGTCADDITALRACVSDAIGEPLGAALIRAAYAIEPQNPVTTTLGGNTTTTLDGTTTTSVTTSTTVTTTTSSTTTTTLVACGDTFPTCDGDCPSGSFCTDTGGQCSCIVAGGACEPATLVRDFNARLGNPGSPSTNLSVGWSGSTHRVDIPDHTGDLVDVTCDASCENCAISLNVEKGGPSVDNCRCSNNPRIVCDEVDAPDADDCGGNTCTCFFGSALAISSGGTPVCVQNTIAGDYSGTMNLRTGEWLNDVNLASLVYLGIDQFAPCPTCDGDPTPNDNIRGGLCNGGLQGGTTCDVNGIHPTFGPTSYDCPPAASSNISGDGLELALQFTTDQVQIDADVPCDSPFGDCPCALCSGDTSIACKSDQECADAGAGTCTGTGGAGIRPNQCDDLICDSATLTCLGGPVDTFCDGTTHADGAGYISCLTDLDCSILGAGNCSIQQNRRCFADPVLASGQPDTLDPVIGAAFCIPATTSLAVNEAGGLPGPGTFEVDFVNDVRCQNDTSRVYEFPDGANCTATTTTTTTTLGLCAAGTPPLCAGACPVGETCVDTGGSCGCQPGSTTTTTLPLCGLVIPPVCGVGQCPVGEACIDIGGTCDCTPTTTTTLPSCIGSGFPVCGGVCPAGFTCVPGVGVCQCL